MIDQKTLILGIPNTLGIEIKVKLIPAILSYHLSQKLLKSQRTQRITGTHFWTRSWPLQTQPWRTPRQGRNLRPGRKHRYVNLLSSAKYEIMVIRMVNFACCYKTHLILTTSIIRDARNTPGTLYQFYAEMVRHRPKLLLCLLLPY